MSPDVTGALEIVAVAMVLGAVAALALFRGRRELARVRTAWEADCDDMRPLPTPDPQRLADASGVDREVGQWLNNRPNTRSWTDGEDR